MIIIVIIILFCIILFFCQVSATFAASLIISPALGAYLGKIYDDSAVVALATFVAASDLLFILIAVPESLPERIRPASWGAPISWEQADPFAVSTNLQQAITSQLFQKQSSLHIKQNWNWNLESVSFCGGRKTRELRAKPLKQG